MKYLIKIKKLKIDGQWRSVESATDALHRFRDYAREEKIKQYTIELKITNNKRKKLFGSKHRILNRAIEDMVKVTLHYENKEGKSASKI